MPPMVPGAAGMQPQPGLTANMPPPPGPPGMAPPVPPGATPTTPPPQPGAQPGGAPGGQQPVVPPPTAPMSDPPPGMAPGGQPLLPANPQMHPPGQHSPKTSVQAQGEANMLGLMESARVPHMAGMGGMQSQSLGMGAKMAWLTGAEKQAIP